MQCSYCKKEISGNSISFADRDFCSDVCQLRFYKEELPNLGGDMITDEEILELEQTSGDKRRDLYEWITLRNMERFDQSKFMTKPKKKSSSEWVVVLKQFFQKFWK